MNQQTNIIRLFILIACILPIIYRGVDNASASKNPLPGSMTVSGITLAKLPETSPTPVSSAEHSSETTTLELEVEPKQIVRGSPCLFVVTASDALTSMSGKWLGKKVFFTPDKDGKIWYGLGGVALETTLGGKVVVLEGRAASGQLITLRANVEVEARKSDIRVPHEYTDPNDEERARIAREAILKSGKFKTLSPHILWTGSFIRPVGGNILVTAAFGGKRRFNSGPIKVHRGMDYGAPPKTSIKAINNGRVILAQNLFYDGNIVAIDHGQGLLSLYLHLSKINVKEGDMVKLEQEIGLSGNTGRASGPHLHLQVKWQGIDIDPAALIQLKLPENLAKAN